MIRNQLQHRAELLNQLRDFFAARQFVEVSTPVACREAIPEAHIDLFSFADRGRPVYLQASPELVMKELLCQGAGPIYQIGPAFRAGDFGPLHRPEFTMVEWYRPGDDMAAGIDLLGELVRATLGVDRVVRTSYADAFGRVLSIDPLTAGDDELRQTIAHHAPQAMPAAKAATDRDELLNILLTQCVEPALGRDGPEIAHHFPATQAALATTTTDGSGRAVAERFELYYRGVELANGYHELTDATELRRRLEAANRARVADGRDAIPLPKRLLDLMRDPGLPPSTGVALGFDRLLMVRLGGETLDDVEIHRP